MHNIVMSLLAKVKVALPALLMQILVDPQNKEKCSKDCITQYGCIGLFESYKILPSSAADQNATILSNFISS